MRLVVTGGAGFIGSAVVRLALSRGHDVLNFDKLTYAANLDSLSPVLPNSGYKLHKEDICDAGAVRRAYEEFKPDAVIHLAAETHVDRSIDGPAEFVQTNIVGTYNLLQGARSYWSALPAAQKDVFRFLHVSTDEVFGTLSDGGLFTEETPYAPNSPYSASKASSDMLVRAWHHTYGLPVLTSNCSNNYGPCQFPEKLVPVVILSALEGKQIPVYGTGQNVRDWLYVEDHANALLTILERGRLGETYNVGGHNELANIDLVRLLCRLMDEECGDAGLKPREKLITFVTDRPGHDFRYAIDATKLETELGWRPSVTVEEGMRQTVRWYLDNAAWWQGIRDKGFDGGRLGLGGKSAR